MKFFKKLVALSLLTTVGFSGSSIKPTSASVLGNIWDMFEGVAVCALVADYVYGGYTKLFTDTPIMGHDKILQWHRK